MGNCFGCEYYGGVVTPATTTREVGGDDVEVCDECAKWYDDLTPPSSGDAGQ